MSRERRSAIRTTRAARFCGPRSVGKAAAIGRNYRRVGGPVAERNSIQLRERLKFDFSRVLSDALEGIAALGQRLGCSREDMAFFSFEDLEVIAQTSGPSDRLVAYLGETIAQRRAEWTDLATLRLPYVIFSS